MWVGLGVVSSQVGGVPCSRDFVAVEPFEFVRSFSDYGLDSVWSFPVGGELPFSWGRGTDVVSS